MSSYTRFLVKHELPNLAPVQVVEPFFDTQYAHMDTLLLEGNENTPTKFAENDEEAALAVAQIKAKYPHGCIFTIYKTEISRFDRFEMPPY